MSYEEHVQKALRWMAEAKTEKDDDQNVIYAWSSSSGQSLAEPMVRS